MSRMVASITTVAALLTLAGCESSQPRNHDVDRHDGGYSQAGDVIHGEVGCALCIYRMPGISDCVLAAKVGDKVMLVEGVGIDDLGDAHDPKTGLCNVARGATIEGRIEGDRLIATRITPQP